MTKLRTPGAFSLMLPEGRKACSVGKPGLIAAALLFVLTLGFAGVCPSAHGQTLNVLYSFGGSATDGVLPIGTLVRDAAGNLYGITYYGGYAQGGCAETGCGILFKLDTTGKLTFLHTFVDKGDGDNPVSLIGDAAGNLAGTTLNSTLFRANAAGKFISINPFQSNLDGTLPNSVILDAQGNRYGTTLAGGDLNCDTGGVAAAPCLSWITVAS